MPLRSTFVLLLTGISYSIILILLFLGDITEQGFRNKKARLEKKYTQTTDSEEPSPMSGSEIADSLSNPSSSVQQSIKTLFGRKSSDSVFCPSAITAKYSRQKKKSVRLPKRITVVYLEDKMHFVPRRKVRDRLIEGGRVEEVLISSSENEQSVHRKIAGAFSTLEGCDEYDFLHVSSSLDLLKAELPQGLSSWSGEAVLQLVGESNSLYIKSRNVSEPKSVSSSPVCQSLPCQPQPVTTASTHQQGSASSHLQSPPIKYSKKPAAHIHPRPATPQTHRGASHIQSGAQHKTRPQVFAVVVGRDEAVKTSYDTGDRIMFPCMFTLYCEEISIIFTLYHDEISII